MKKICVIGSLNMDLVVKVDIEDMSLFEISKFRYAYDKGYEAGLANVEKIKELLK